MVPTTAVIQRGQLSLVFVVEDGKARLRLVTLGESRGETVEVLSGLGAGDRIVGAPTPELVEDARVEELS